MGTQPTMFRQTQKCESVKGVHPETNKDFLRPEGAVERWPIEQAIFGEEVGLKSCG